MQIDKFKEKFNMLTEPIIERTVNTICLEIFNFNLNINPSEEDMKNIENTLCRLVAVSEYIKFDGYITTDQYTQLEQFTRTSWKNSKIINNTKAYVCIIYTKFLMEFIENIIQNQNAPQSRTEFLNNEIKFFVGSLFTIIAPEDFSQHNSYLYMIAFTSICEILCFVREDWANICKITALANMQPVVDESSLLQLENFLIQYVFIEKMDTSQSEKRSLQILERNKMLRMWRKLFECNDSLPICNMSNTIFLHIITVSFILF